MVVDIVANYDEMSLRAADIVAGKIREHPDAALGFATGGTPIGLYRELVRRHVAEGLDFSRITTFNLDEYLGLPAEHEQSYHYFMHKHLFSQVNVQPDRVHIPDGLAPNPTAHCTWYEDKISHCGGLELQILGIGTNGHLGFNEPGASLGSRTRVVALARTTRQDNARFFNSIDEVPAEAITMGIGTILEAKTVLLLASGSGKAQAISASLEGPVTAMVPASALQLHPDVHVVIDRAAAASLVYDHHDGIAEPKP